MESEVLRSRIISKFESVPQLPRRSDGDVWLKLASELASGFGIISYQGELYCFNGRYYERLEMAVLKIVVEDLVIRYELPKSLRGRMYERISNYCRTLTVGGKEDSRKVNKYLYCFSNGVVDLSSPKRRLMPFSDEHIVFSQRGYEYDVKASCPAFHKFLDTVLPEKASQYALQELCGCIFLGENVQKMGLFWGKGANGKSVFHKVITKVLGDENVGHYDMGKLTRGGDCEKNLASLEGKLLNYSEEMTTSSVNDDLFKTLTDNTPLEVRQIYARGKVVYTNPMFFGNVNGLPSVTDSFYAVMRRIMIFRFSVVIPAAQRNPHLSEDLVSAESSGIMEWVLTGLDRYRKQRVFTQSPIMEESRRVMMRSVVTADSLESFIMNNGYTRGGETILVDLEWFASEYAAYLHEEMEGECVPDIPHEKIGRVLRKLGFECVRDASSVKYKVYKPLKTYCYGKTEN